MRKIYVVLKQYDGAPIMAFENESDAKFFQRKVGVTATTVELQYAEKSALETYMTVRGGDAACILRD